MAGQDGPGATAAPAAVAAPELGVGAPRPDRPRRGGPPALRARLWKFLESRGIILRTGILSIGQRHELLIRGRSGTATVLGVRLSRAVPATGAQNPCYRIWVRVQPDDLPSYETRVRQRVSDADLEFMRPGDVIGCRIDPGDPDRVVLYVPGAAEATRVSITKILSSGRRADATVLAATPIAADYSGRDDPLLRLDLELRAWDEPDPWRVRIVQAVPLPAIELVDLGRHLEVAFFAVDRGESVAVDWEASAEP